MTGVQTCALPILLLLDQALLGGKVADPTQRDEATIARREVIKVVRESELWMPMLLPVGDGILVATKNN